MYRTIVSGVVAATVAFACSTFAQAQSIGMATSQPGSFYHTQSSMIAAMLASKAGIQPRVQPYASPNVFLPVVNAGQIALGFANIYETALAIQGAAYFNGFKHTNLRLVTITSPLRVGLFVRKDSPIKKVADLKGKRLGWGFAAQNIIMNLLTMQLEMAGLTEKDVVKVPVPAIVPGADLFASGRTDAFFFSLGSAKVTEINASVKGVRLLPLENTPAMAAIAAKHIPNSYITLAQPGKGLAGIDAPTGVHTYDAVFLTNAQAPDELIYRITKAMYDNAGELAKSTPTLSGFARDKMAKNTGDVHYHPGAIRFYKEQKVWPGE